MSNFDLKKYLAEGKLYEAINLEYIVDDIVILSGDSGEYEGEIEDGKASFSVIYDDLDYRIKDQYNESNIEDFLGKGHAFVELSKKYDHNWDIESDLVGITVELPDLAEGKLFEESIPSGWKKIDTSNDYEEEERQGRLMGFEAPMSGIEGDEVDNIYIEQDGDEYEVHVMTAFNNPEYEGPFSSKEEALKVAIQKMEDLKKDWDE